MISLNGAASGGEIDEVPAAISSMGGAAAVEDDGKMIGLEIGDGVAMGVAVEIEADAAVASDDFLEFFAAQEIAARFIVLEKGIVIEKENGIGWGEEREDFF